MFGARGAVRTTRAPKIGDKSYLSYVAEADMKGSSD
jgi:hypothetical protein